jgi:hypothetical protein
MFESTGSFTLFEYFRVPYDQAPHETADLPDTVSLAVRGEPTTLSWPTTSRLVADGRRANSFLVGSMRLFGHVLPDSEVRASLRRAGGDWRSVHQVRDEHGTHVGAVWQKDDGSTFLPFDPNELIGNFWSEQYVAFVRTAVATRFASLARRGYYRARPLLPRSVQMKMRRSFSRLQSKSSFPRWPVETTLHDFYDFLFDLVADVAERPVPFIGAWPGEWSWALVLTHDVEGQAGYENLQDLLQVELDAGYRSSWNFVPRNRYVVEDDLVQELRNDGFEVGVHGLYHDGRDLSSAATLRRRLPAIRSYAERWQATGFRSPGTLRSARLMPLLGFDYDSSYSDTAPFEPQPGGCCSWLPYMIEDLVELPITLAQDHTLFDLLRYTDESLWLEKARFVRDRGGMALILTHSDYVGNRDLLGSYCRFLEEFAADSSAWKALPRDVSDWWRRRSKSTLREVEGGWSVVGPAEDEARVEFALPQGLPV